MYSGTFRQEKSHRKNKSPNDFSINNVYWKLNIETLKKSMEQELRDFLELVFLLHSFKLGEDLSDLALQLADFQPKDREK